MSKPPKRKKTGSSQRAGRASRQRRSAGDPLPAGPHELDLQTLVVLSVGEWWHLADHEWPPDAICRWLEAADPPQLRGLLLATLERWHELRRP